MMLSTTRSPSVAWSLLLGLLLISWAGSAEADTRSFLGACPGAEALVDKVRAVAHSPDSPEKGRASVEEGSDPADLLAEVLSLAVEQAIDGSGPEPSQVDRLLDLRDLLVENPCYSGVLAVDSINRALLAVLGRWLIAPGSGAQRSAALERVPRLRGFELKAELFAPWIDGVAAACREDTGCLVATVLKAGPGPVIEAGTRLGMQQLLEHPESRLLILRMMRTDQDLHIGLPVLRSLVETTQGPVEELAERTIQERLEMQEELPPEAGSLLIRRERYGPIRAMSFVKLLRSRRLRLYALLDGSIEDFMTQYAKSVVLTARPVRSELETWAPIAVRLLLYYPGSPGSAYLVALEPQAVARTPEDAETRQVLGTLMISTPGGVPRELWLVPELDAGRPRQVHLPPGGGSWAGTVFLFPEDVVDQSHWIEGEYRLAVNLRPFWFETEAGEGRILAEASLAVSGLRVDVAPTPPRLLTCLQSGGAEQFSGALRGFLEGRWRFAGEARVQASRWKAPSCEGTEIARVLSLLEIAETCGGGPEPQASCTLEDEDHKSLSTLIQDPAFLLRDEAKELLGEAVY